MELLIIVFIVFVIIIIIFAKYSSSEDLTLKNESHNDFMKRLASLEPAEVKITAKRNFTGRRSKDEIRQDLISNALEEGFRSSLIVENYALIKIIEITGIHVEGRYGRIRRLKENSKLELEKEPDNPFDKRAVRITNKDNILGYVPKTELSLVRRIMQYEYAAHLYDAYNDDGFKRAHFAIYLKK